MKFLKSRKIDLFILLILSAVVTGIIFFILKSSPVLAAVHCECTDYVYTVKNLTGNYPNAYEWNDGFLANNNYSENSTPEVGDIVVFETSFPGAPAGHVAIFESINSSGKITVRGANQLDADEEEAGCNNVNSVTFGTSINGRSDVSFWRPTSSGGGGSCNPPSSGTWNVTSSCDITSNTTAPGDVAVSNGATLHVKNGATLNIDFVNHKLTVTGDSKVLIDANSKME